MSLESESKKWNTVYPLYFDAGKSLAGGRRVGKNLAIASPTCEQVHIACQMLGLSASVEKEKRHPRNPFLFGRVKVQLYQPNGEGRVPVNSEIPNVPALLRAIGGKLPAAVLEAAIPAKPVRTATPPVVTQDASGVTLSIRKKSKGGKKK